MTLDEILTPELREAWPWPEKPDIPILADAIRDLVALAMEQEWQRTKMKLEGYQPRAFYKWPDWQRAAEERLKYGAE